MAELQSTNVQGSLCVNGVAIGGGKDFKFCCYTASDTFTPSQDLVDGGGTLSSIVVAGGGGGGAAAGCATSGCASCAFSGAGGGGEVINYLNTVTSITGCTVTVGAGGTGGVATDVCTISDAGKGGNSSFFGTTVYGGGGGAGRSYSCNLGINRSCNANLCGGPRGGNANATINYAPQVRKPINNAINGGGFNSTQGTGGAYGGFCDCCPTVLTNASSTVQSSLGTVPNAVNAVYSNAGNLGFGGGGVHICSSANPFHKHCGRGGCGVYATSNQSCDGEDGEDGIVILTWME